MTLQYGVTLIQITPFSYDSLCDTHYSGDPAADNAVKCREMCKQMQW